MAFTKPSTAKGIGRIRPMPIARAGVAPAYQLDNSLANIVIFFPIIKTIIPTINTKGNLLYCRISITQFIHFIRYPPITSRCEWVCFSNIIHTFHYSWVI